MKPTFPTLAVLTAIALVLLVPLFISDWYLPIVRDSAFYFHQILRRGLYKQITGFICLGFFALEMILTLRKRGRRWKIKLPGSILFWRSFHIFLGVAFVGMAIVHTVGAIGSTFNRVFLIVFLTLSLVAMFGVALETWLVGTIDRKITLLPVVGWLTFPKGQLIRSLRSVWLGVHIVLVSLFGSMLSIHILLAFYFQ
ncbi:hypothetical protein [Synechococcus sp. PCC 7336]|uniref:hypothetical protein n=1 Tax=Synechococcus sp. PCC 7336 TaxID=195250 RepID=UPI000345226A|nr:hypothetical protein [Synechococcus sp. PCC 7336]